MIESSRGEALMTGVKATPPLVVSAFSAAGLTLEEWVFVATLIYLTLSIAHLVWKFFRERARDRGARDDD